MRDTALYKSLVVILLFISIVLQTNARGLELSAMHYVWPMRLLVIGVFGVMVSGMVADPILGGLN